MGSWVHGFGSRGKEGELSFRSVARNLGVRVAQKRPSAAHPPGFLATLRNDNFPAGVVSTPLASAEPLSGSGRQGYAATVVNVNVHVPVNVNGFEFLPRIVTLFGA
jgi:hypothetical protein